MLSDSFRMIEDVVGFVRGIGQLIHRFVLVYYNYDLLIRCQIVGEHVQWRYDYELKDQWYELLYYVLQLPLKQVFLMLVFHLIPEFV